MTDFIRQQLQNQLVLITKQQWKSLRQGIMKEIQESFVNETTGVKIKKRKLLQLQRISQPHQQFFLDLERVLIENVIQNPIYNPNALCTNILNLLREGILLEESKVLLEESKTQEIENIFYHQHKRQQSQIQQQQTIQYDYECAFTHLKLPENKTFRIISKIDYKKSNWFTVCPLYYEIFQGLIILFNLSNYMKKVFTLVKLQQGTEEPEMDDLRILFNRVAAFVYEVTIGLRLIKREGSMEFSCL